MDPVLAQMLSEVAAERQEAVAEQALKFSQAGLKTPDLHSLIRALAAVPEEQLEFVSRRVFKFLADGLLAPIDCDYVIEALGETLAGRMEAVAEATETFLEVAAAAGGPVLSDRVTQIIHALAGIHDGDLGAVVTTVLPLVVRYGFAGTCSGLIFAVAAVPSERRSDVIAAAENFVVGGQANQSAAAAAKVVSVLAKVRPEDLGDVVEQSLRLTDLFTYGWSRGMVIAAVAAVASPERRSRVVAAAERYHGHYGSSLIGPRELVRIVAALAKVAAREEPDAVVEQAIRVPNCGQYVSVIEAVAAVPPEYRDAVVDDTCVQLDRVSDDPPVAVVTAYSKLWRLRGARERWGDGDATGHTVLDKVLDQISMAGTGEGVNWDHFLHMLEHPEMQFGGISAPHERRSSGEHNAIYTKLLRCWLLDFQANRPLDTRVIEILVGCGAQPRMSDIATAAYAGRTAVLHCLLAGWDHDKVRDLAACGLPQAVAQRGNVGVLVELDRVGCPLNKRHDDFDGETPLERAIRDHQPEVAGLLYNHLLRDREVHLSPRVRALISATLESSHDLALLESLGGNPCECVFGPMLLQLERGKLNPEAVQGLVRNELLQAYRWSPMGDVTAMVNQLQVHMREQGRDDMSAAVAQAAAEAKTLFLACGFQFGRFRSRAQRIKVRDRYAPTGGPPSDEGAEALRDLRYGSGLVLGAIGALRRLRKEPTTMESLIADLAQEHFIRQTTERLDPTPGLYLSRSTLSMRTPVGGLYQWAVKEIDAVCEHADPDRVGHRTGYRLTYELDGETVTFTRVKAPFYGDDPGYNWEWFHGMVGIERVWPRLNQLFREVMELHVDPRDPASMKRFYDKVVEIIWLMGNATIRDRGTGTLVQQVFALLHLAKGLMPPVLQLDTPQIDCLDISLPLGRYKREFRERFLEEESVGVLMPELEELEEIAGPEEIAAGLIRLEGILRRLPPDPDEI